MNFCHFKLLTLPSQISHTCNSGIYLSQRAEDECIIALYQLQNFYVEVYRNSKTFEIIKVISFHSPVLLDPYLKAISIKDLLVSSAVSGTSD